MTETKQELLILNGKEYILDVKQAEKLGLLKEKYGRVKSWEEFKRKHPNQFFHCSSSQLTTYEEKALSAFSKLLKLRRDWVGEWEPDWNFHSNVRKYVIINWGNRVKVEFTNTMNRSLSFPTERMAEEFLETFRDLIEESKILI